MSKLNLNQAAHQVPKSDSQQHPTTANSHEPSLPHTDKKPPAKPDSKAPWSKPKTQNDGKNPPQGKK